MKENNKKTQSNKENKHWQSVEKKWEKNREEKERKKKNK